MSKTTESKPQKKKFTSLKVRLTTGIIFALVMVIGTVSCKYTFYTLYSMIVLFSLREFYSHILESTKGLLYTSVIVGLATYWIYTYRLEVNMLSQDIAIAMIFPIMWFVLFLALLFKNREDPVKEIGVVFLGFIYIVFPLALLQKLSFKGLDFNPFWPFVLLIMTWANDCWAYLFGNWFGKTPFAPHISPKKTWEGAIGGIIASFLFAMLFGYGASVSKEEAWTIFRFLADNNDLPSNYIIWGVFGAIVSISAILGDLIESVFKRSLNLKDSGDFLPGHGGLLDRFDALLFVIPFASAYIFIIKILYHVP